MGLPPVLVVQIRKRASLPSRWRPLRVQELLVDTLMLAGRLVDMLVLVWRLVARLAGLELRALWRPRVARARPLKALLRMR